MENITLDPEYEKLIIDVNKLKDTVAEKIAERDMLAFHVVTDIETQYMLKIGTLEDETFIANLKLLKLNREIELYKEKKKKKKPIDEKEIQEQLELEFGDIEDEYSEIQDEDFFGFEDELETKVTEELLRLLTIIYKNLIKRLSPLINFNNTLLDNQLYEILERAYKEFDLTMMLKIQTICEQIKPDTTLTIGDVKTLRKTKEKYLNLIADNEGIITHIKESESFQKKKILDDEKLTIEAIENLRKELEAIERKIETAEKDLKKIKNEL